MKYTEGKFKLRSHNKSYCLIDVVTKAGLTNRSICIISCLLCYDFIKCYY